MMKSIANKIYKRIRDRKRGWVFTPRDFLDLGGREVVDQTLSRLVKSEKIRRLRRGIYDYPQFHPRFGEMSPNLYNVAKAIAKSSDSRIQISGARAANSLGLSTQVPAKLVFLTDGSSRKIQIGNQTIIFKKTTPRKLVGINEISGTVFQAFRYLGSNVVDNSTIERLSISLDPKDKKVLSRDVPSAPTWMQNAINQIIQST